MRAFLKSSRRWLAIGWFWPLLLLALPNCASLIGIRDWDGGPGRPPLVFDPGPEPRTSGVRCDIPQGPSQCVTQQELDNGLTGVALTHAAIALNTGDGSLVALDYSPNNGCNGLPRKTVLRDLFPDGTPVCLNCNTQLHTVFPDANAVCAAQCQDLFTLEGVEPPGGALAFCQANAHVSTNFDPTTCFENMCSNSGQPLVDFADPRRNPDAIKWEDQSLIGTTTTIEPTGSTLKRIAASPAGHAGDFDAGASGQAVQGGDGWVEFAANENDLSHVLGLSSLSACFPDCNDQDPSLEDVDFAISLNYDGQMYVIESDGPNLTVIGPLGTYSAGERFRVRFTDNLDGTAAISYTRVGGFDPSCPANTECPITQHVGPGPKYPLGVGARLREENAQLTNATIVYIKK